MGSHELGKKKLAIEALQYNRYPYIDLDDLWQALHQTFNLVQNYQINLSLLDETLSRSIME